MTLREPLVIIGGQIQQLPSGDTINGVTAVASHSFEATNNEASPLTLGLAVYMNAADGVKALTANTANSVKYVGLVADNSIGSGNTGNIQFDGVLTGNTSQWSAVGVASGLLVAGTTYYVSDSVTGNLTETAPTTVASYVIPVGIGINATDLRLFPKTIVKL